MTKTITKNCLHCNIEFAAPLKEIKRGNGKYCSIPCGRASRKGIKKHHEPNTECSFCQKLVYKSPSRIKTKSGFIFCSRECKDKAQGSENYERFNTMMPSHYNADGSKAYRSIALRNKPLKCEDCGFDRIPEVCEVHHIDRNRKNSSLDNLKILCPTCHEIDHFLNGDGRFKGNKLKR